MTPPASPAPARPSASRRLHGLAAALAGLAIAALLALLADQLLRALGLPPPAGQPMPELGRQSLASWLRAAGLLAGGPLAGPSDVARPASHSRRLGSSAESLRACG